MAVNLGSVAVAAIQELRGNKHFEDLVEALDAFAQNLIIAAIAAPPANRVDETSRARGFYEVWQAVATSYTGKHMTQVKPTALGRLKERVNAE
jgi:hypothetical protein